jgi:ubiquitin-protein ligase
MGYESSAERWSPVQSVEKILLSVVSMLAGTSNGVTFYARYMSVFIRKKYDDCFLGCNTM